MIIFSALGAILSFIAIIAQYDHIIRLRSVLSKEVLSEYDREAIDNAIFGAWLLMVFFVLSIVSSIGKFFEYMGAIV
jgi:hypothetical protein